jgi:molybdate transport system substrate-binding protein
MCVHELQLGSVETRRILCVVASLAVLAAGVAARSEIATQKPPLVAAAANLNFTLAEIAAQFARDEGSRIEIVLGSSGTLARQIQEGAPFEMFLAADEELPRRLSAAGPTRDDGAVYAVGKLVIFAPTDSSLTVDAELAGLARLVRAGGVRRFAIANPDVAPYGKAAEAVLRKRGLWDVMRPSLVLGDTIAQAAQFATTGNATGGLIAYSLVLEPAFADRGRYAVVPDADHPPLRQRMVLLRHAGPVAAAFYDYMRGDAARAILKKHGYGVPQ